jgi:hypothetical protein
MSPRDAKTRPQLLAAQYFTRNLLIIKVLRAIPPIPMKTSNLGEGEGAYALR